MTIRGVTKNIALNPLLYKDLDPSENFIPTHMELRNGYLSDNGNWHKRPGYAQKWDLGIDRPVQALIEELGGYAITDNGRVFKLTTTPTEMTGARLTGGFPPTHCNYDDLLIVADGGRPIRISNDTALLGGSPSNYKFVDRLGPYTIGCGHNNTEFEWSASGNPENWKTGDSGFANVQKEGFDDRIRYFKVTKNKAYFFEGHDVEVWYNRGGSTPFVRIDLVEGGIDADYSVVQEGDVFYALMNNRRFGVLRGVTWEPIPPEAPMEDYIQNLPYVDDCVGYKFEKEHLIKWVFGRSGYTVVYDYKHKRWSEDNHWEHGQFERLPVASYMETGNKQYIGSYNNDGLIHEWSKNSKDDNGSPIRVFRKFKVRLTEGTNSARVNNLGFRLKRGVATSSVPFPKFSCRYRFDEGGWVSFEDIDMGGASDHDPYTQNMGPLGEGKEIEFEVSETDAVDYILTEMNLTVEQLG